MERVPGAGTGTAVGFLEVLPAAHHPAPVAQYPAAEVSSLGSRGEERPTSPGVEVVVRRGKELVVRVDREFDAGVLRRVVQALEEVEGC